ncbi:MAG: flagellar M-ring protein FliF [Desulfarculus sp.]|nr:flagellar M-ring protein FliF [Desulfarculus sp.]
MAEDQDKAKGLGLLKEAVGGMSTGRRLVFMAGGALVVGGLIALMLWINQPEYQTLYAGMAQRDASQVVAKLKDLKVPYRLEGDGGTIKVPQENLHEARLALAGEGLPRGQGIGFEVFNKVEMGTTDFVQKINYQRALQGELARTIASFGEVEEARVHIVMPRDSLFVEEEKKPSAGVVVRLSAGKVLSPSQIAGIVHLVASSVPDLTDDRVTIVDTKGNLIYRKQTDSAEFAAGLTAGQMDYQRNYEKALRAKVQSMLEEVLGPGRAVVRVAADLDFTRTNITQDLFDPEAVAIRSESRNSDSSKNTSAGPEGSPDQRYTLAQQNATPGQKTTQQGSESNREGETTNFEISRTQKQITQAMGGLKRLTVAVVVDGPYKEEAGEKGQTTRTFTPRSAEEMRQLTEIVQRAVGFNQGRGDEVTMANVPFAIAPSAGVMAGKAWQDYLKEYGKPALNLILVLAFLLLVARPLVSAYLASRPAPAAARPGAPGARRVGPGEELPAGAEGAAMLEEPAAPRKITTREQILALVSQDSERTTSLLRAWIRQP